MTSAKGVDHLIFEEEGGVYAQFVRQKNFLPIIGNSRGWDFDKTCPWDNDMFCQSLPKMPCMYFVHHFVLKDAIKIPILPSPQG